MAKNKKPKNDDKVIIKEDINPVIAIKKEDVKPKPKVINDFIMVESAYDAKIVAKYKGQIGKNIRTPDGRQF